MKKIFGLVVLSVACLSANSAMAGGAKKLQGGTAPAAAKNPAKVNCSKSADYCVKVVLSRVLGKQGSLQIFSNNNGTWKEQGGKSVAIGGNPNAWNDTAIFTPSGVKTVYDKTPTLWYNGKWDAGYDSASYFYDPNPLKGRSSEGSAGNEVAIHTAPSYSKNSHGCVRSPAAPSVYALQGKVQVDVVYQ